MSAITICLEGALHGWGDTGSSLYFRPAADYPKKSTIVGMLGAALGYEVEDPRLVDLFNRIEVRVLYDKSDKGELLEDFCTVNGALVAADKNNTPYLFDEDGYPEAIKIMTANGEENNKTIVIKKQYRVGATYHVEIKGEDNLITEIAEAISHPVYPIFLGRKCCPGNIYVCQN